MDTWRPTDTLALMGSRIQDKWRVRDTLALKGSRIHGYVEAHRYLGTHGIQDPG